VPIRDALPATDAELARALSRVQYAAYAVEAALIQDDRIPPLHEDQHDLRQAPLLAHHRDRRSAKWSGRLDTEARHKLQGNADRTASVAARARRSSRAQRQVRMFWCRRLAALGHEVSVADSRGPETLRELAVETGATAFP
jgi:hypothetical protein